MMPSPSSQALSSQLLMQLMLDAVSQVLKDDENCEPGWEHNFSVLRKTIESQAPQQEKKNMSLSGR